MIGVIWNYILRPAGNPMLLFGGAAVVILAIVVDALAYRNHAVSSAKGAAKFSVKGLVLKPCQRRADGSFYPLVEMSRAGEIGLGPYTAAVMFAIGVVITTFVFNLYFMNLPVEGEPVPSDVFSRRHQESPSRLRRRNGMVRRRNHQFHRIFGALRK